MSYALNLEISELKAEIERLRAALKEIAAIDPDAPPWEQRSERHIALEALGSMSSPEARLRTTNTELVKALESLRWRSIDKDNMEFECRTTCFVLDAIRAAIAKAKGEV